MEMSQGENDYEDVLQHLTSTIGAKLVEGAKKTKLFSSTCIYRVPHDLRKVNERAYTPRLITIGPLHRNDEHLQTPMQHVKMSYANNLLCRLTTGMESLELAEKRNAVLLHECLAEMKKLIVDANNCYLADVTLDEEMLLVDGCFILEFLYRARLLRAEDNENKPIDGGDNGNSKVWKADPIFDNRPTLFDVENDLVLLENQIPYFVLEKLFQLAVGRIRDRLDKNWLLTDYVRWCYRKRIRPVHHSNKKKVLMPSDCVLGIFGCTTAAAEEEVQFGNVDHRTANCHQYDSPKRIP
ncbi:uncharacterized protein LOC131327923 [Rhododendron vialii]|uniref:uncharacterized protein LOC131327923 n=1 Tax=Rhododendron vialii TaxID=182163 RepID=UPI00265ECF4B|nr:uncharacterized protein LOC131327923 [Rhododendron vialii]